VEEAILPTEDATTVAKVDIRPVTAPSVGLQPVITAVKLDI